VTTTERAERVQRVAAVGLIGVLVIGCGGSDSGADEPAPNVSRPDIAADLDVALDGGGLAVRYTVTNDGSVPLLVVNRLPRPSGATVVFDDQVVYVVPDGDDRAEVAQRLFAAPADGGVDYAQAPQAGATLITPGDTVSGDLVVPLPLEPSAPFGEEELSSGVASARFCLGVLPASVTDAQPDDDGVVPLGHGPLADRQYLECSDDVALD